MLLALSLVFYGWWDWRYLPLIMLSVVLNWAVAEVFRGRRESWMIVAAIALNLAVLGLFKYSGFLACMANAIPGLSVPRVDWALPLGISFFTFHHIMYLTDLNAGRAPRYDLVRYGLYITFFPQVLAGPLVRWSEVMHQFEDAPYRPGWEERIGRGLLLLVMGLGKKVLIGDPLSDYAEPVFKAAAAGTLITVLEAWQGVLAFTFQIYFDFSGYTDMALGLALMFGIVLPQNFNVAVPGRLAAGLLAALAHDAVALPARLPLHPAGRQPARRCPGRCWRSRPPWGSAGSGTARASPSSPGAWRTASGSRRGWAGRGRACRCRGRSALALTFLFVMLTWVLFRAQTFEAAERIYAAMAGFAPIGGGFKWRMLVVGRACWRWWVRRRGSLSQTAKPRTWVAVTAALLFMVILLKIGDDATYEFIYFQF